jgi:hypothetical protein
MAGVIREAVRKVERCLGIEQGATGRRKRGRRQGAQGGNPEDSRGGMAVSGSSVGDAATSFHLLLCSVFTTAFYMFYAILGLPEQNNARPAA